jgi:transposase InsO family protein
MSWRVTSVVRERARFAAEWQQQRFDGAMNFAALCRAFGISRQTGYKWIERFLRARGDVRALEDRSRRPHSSPEATPEEIVRLVVKARKARPHWGPKTLRAWLVRQGTPIELLPAASTIGDVLKREGLVRQRRRRTRTPPSMARPSVEADCPNAVWGIDFKGWFRTADGLKCFPLTIVDAYSRFLVRCEATATPDERFVRDVLTSAFREHGLPDRIRSDNGVPFASVAAGGLSKLSVWWIKLGIRPERIQPGKPQQNGRQERFHLTLKRETTMPAKASLRAQQRAFDRFRQRYNEERPHHALGMAVPDELHAPSTRRFLDDPPDPSYPPTWETLRANGAGCVTWDGESVFVGSALARELVGARPLDGIRYELYFGPILLGLLDPLKGKLRLIRSRRPRNDKPALLSGTRTKKRQ